jgi:hypothetical protein
MSRAHCIWLALQVLCPCYAAKVHDQIDPHYIQRFRRFALCCGMSVMDNLVGNSYRTAVKFVTLATTKTFQRDLAHRWSTRDLAGMSVLS